MNIIAPTTPSGAAGGGLKGSYPNPGLLHGIASPTSGEAVEIAGFKNTWEAGSDKPRIWIDPFGYFHFSGTFTKGEANKAVCTLGTPFQPLKEEKITTSVVTAVEAGTSTICYLRWLVNGEMFCNVAAGTGFVLLDGIVIPTFSNLIPA